LDLRKDEKRQEMSSRALREALFHQFGVQRGRLDLSCFSNPVAQGFLRTQWVNDSSFRR